jgi:hypothetical protein
MKSMLSFKKLLPQAKIVRRGGIILAKFAIEILIGRIWKKSKKS